MASEPQVISDKEQKAYQDFLHDLMVMRLRVGLLLVMILVPMLHVYLGVTYPQSSLPYMLEIYLFHPILLVLFFTLGLSWFRKYSFWIVMISNMSIPLSLVILLAIMGVSWTSPEYSFLISISIIAMGVLYPFLPRQFAFFCLWAMMVYLVPVCFFEENLGWRSYFYNVCAISFFSVVILTVSYSSSKLRKDNFFYQLNLKKLNLALEEEKEKSESLLHNMLPVAITERLKQGEKKIADKYAETTVMFLDLVGFAKLSSSMLPTKIVDIIDNVFSRFDHIVEKHGIEKIKTLGDGYMTASGVPIENERHAQDMAKAAIEMKEAIHAFNLETGRSLNFRIGIHSGSLVAGVIGQKKMSYDIWGNTVNIASRMESYGESGKIQVSESTWNLLQEEFEMEERGEMEVKGIGTMKTYFLLGSLDPSLSQD